MATCTIDTGPIYEAVGMQHIVPSSGSLKINRRRGRGEFVEIGVDAKRALQPFTDALIRFNYDATLDYFVRLQEENGGVFPENELINALAEELAPFRGQIEYTGSGTFRGDRLLTYKRSELIEQ